MHFMWCVINLRQCKQDIYGYDGGKTKVYISSKPDPIRTRLEAQVPLVVTWSGLYERGETHTVWTRDVGGVN